MCDNFGNHCLDLFILYGTDALFSVHLALFAMIWIFEVLASLNLILLVIASLMFVASCIDFGTLDGALYHLLLL